MKTMRVFTIIFWAVAAIALIGLAIWFLTGSVFGIGRNGWSVGAAWESISGPFEAAGTYSVGVDNVSSIYIDWVSGDITVIPYDGGEIQITEYARRELHDDEKLQYSSASGTLSIKFSSGNSWMRNMPSKKLEVYIPRKISENFDSFSIDSTSGGVSVENISAGAFKADTVSGKINLTNITSQTFEANTTSGSVTISSVYTDDIKFNSVSGTFRLTDVNAKKLSGNSTSGDLDLSGAFDAVDVDSISGRISITSSVVPWSLKADSTSGNITVTVPDDGPISVSHSSVSGKLSSDIPIITQGKDPQFRFSTVSGEVKIHALG